MNFICAISKKIIKKNNNVRVFFIKSKLKSMFPFMNSLTPESTGNFVPLGVAFKAKLIETERDEILDFTLDGKKSDLKDVFISHINKNAISKEAAKEKDLLNYKSEDIEWDNMDTLNNVFNRVLNSALYLKDGEFVTAMIVQESVYKLMLSQGNLERAIEHFKNKLNSEEFLEIKAKEKEAVKRHCDSIKSELGTYQTIVEEETVLVTEEIVQMQMKNIEYYKNSEKKENREIYKSLEDESRQDIGKIKKLNLSRKRYMDEELINRECRERKLHLMGYYENKYLQDSAYCANSDNFLNKEQMTQVVVLSFKKSNWLPILESYVVETMMKNSGLEYLPSRRQYLNTTIENKDFFQAILNLK